MQTQKLWNKYLSFDCRCHVLYNYNLINEVFSNAHENTNFPSIPDPWTTRSRFCKYERGLSKISWYPWSAHWIWRPAENCGKLSKLFHNLNCQQIRKCKSVLYSTKLLSSESSIVSITRQWGPVRIKFRQASHTLYSSLSCPTFSKCHPQISTALAVWKI